MKPAIETINLTKVFEVKERKGLKGLFDRSRRRIVAVDHVNLKIYEGEVFGLLGPNGAGKTTMVKMLCTLLEPTDGEAYVNGFHVVKEADRVKESLGVMLTGERTLYWKLTGRENLEYFAALYHLKPREARVRADRLLELVGLKDRANTLVEEYSTGMRVRLSFAKALLNDAPIIFFDEPTLSLDPQGARRLRDVILELRKAGRTILLTTHYMEEADMLCDRVGIIDKGRIIALGTPGELKGMLRKEDVIEVEGFRLADVHLRQVKALTCVKKAALTIDDPVSSHGKLRVIAFNSREATPHILNILMKGDAKVELIKATEPTLEDVFIDLTGRALRD